MVRARLMNGTTPSLANHVAFLNGRGELPMLEILTRWSRAELYLHGGQVTHFQKEGEPPILFTSQCSRFEPGVPIRGGIPVIFPWFGQPEGRPHRHGIARLRDWALSELATGLDGSLRLCLRMPEVEDGPDCPACAVESELVIRDTLTVEVRVTNQSERPFTFELCLQTYLTVGDVRQIWITGLQDTVYLDATTGGRRTRDTAPRVTIQDEVDRIYLNTARPVEVHDPVLQRTVRVEKNGSASTIIWNPGPDRARSLPDLGDDEYLHMVCVECGNVADNALTLPPGSSTALQMILSSKPGP